MLIDNKSEGIGESKTIHEYFLNNFLVNGQLDIVTGYFTIKALSSLKIEYKKQSQYRIILGDLLSLKPNRKNIIDLIQESHQISNAFNLKEACERAVEFLRQESVLVKTVDKNFCHAKMYIFDSNTNRTSDKFYIVGSSNFTEAGLGVRLSPNIELNKVINGTDDSYKNGQKWFNQLWVDIAQDKVKNDQNELISCKEYLINLILTFFEKYSPEILYFKTLYELFKEELLQMDLNENKEQDFIHLKDTTIFSKLFNFQQKGVLSLIRMLKNYDGAILADAVGLGKTWSALALIKYFELKGYKVLLLCPKKLKENWNRYRKDRGSLFESDKFEYQVRHHTDLHLDRFEKEGLRLENFQRFPKLLIVIDESHNLRNDKSQRYEFLLEEIYKKRINRETKTLLLSATPINNSFWDIRNQFKLIVGGENAGFEKYEELEVKSLERVFRDAQKVFNEWIKSDNRKILELKNAIPDGVFKLTDATVVARTRHLIKNYLKENIDFPEIEKPENHYVDKMNIGELKTFSDIIEILEKVKMSAYQPIAYTQKGKEKRVDIDEVGRQKGVARLMSILLMKRMESSWIAFDNTLSKVLAYHRNAKNILEEYLAMKDENDKIKFKRDEKIKNKEESYNTNLDEQSKDDLDSVDIDTSMYEIGNKEPVSMKDITLVEKFTNDLNSDLLNLQKLKDNLNIFKETLSQEKKQKAKSGDSKLATLLEVIAEKRKDNPKRKIILFSVFRDTAKYIFEELESRGFKNLALITGEDTENIEAVLERFAPYTKMYKEKDWSSLYSEHKINSPANYEEWLEKIPKLDKKVKQVYDNPVDLLIATDVISEGQNLQDADCLINYDIHWNPVRLIQRIGRIDRIGSPNKKIYGVNFWPGTGLEDYLKLIRRVESRMAVSSLIGAEIQTLSKNMEDMLDENETLLSKQAVKMLKQFETDWKDIDEDPENFGFNDLSYESFRQELFEMLASKKEELEKIPNGVYSGFNILPLNKLNSSGSGIMGLIGYPAKKHLEQGHKYTSLELFYISANGKNLYLNNMQVLNTLRDHKSETRFVPDFIDSPNQATLEKLKDLLEKWMKQKFHLEDSSDVDDLFSGKKSTKDLKEEIAEDRYKLDKYDLITWFVVSRGNQFNWD